MQNVEKVKTILGRASIVAVPVAILIWMLWLPSGTAHLEAFQSTNLIMGIMGLFGFYFYKKSNQSITKKQNTIINVFSVLFTLASVLGALSSSADRDPFMVIVSCFGAYAGVYSVMHSLLTSKTQFFKREHNLKFKPSTIFWICFSAAALIFLGSFILGFYPGVLTPDSLSQVQQNLTGEFVNDHPLSHTLIVGFFLNIGMVLFGNINVGVAFYSIFQIIAMSAIFSFVIMTLYQRKAPLWVLVFAAVWYFAHPANILNSFTMWKDVLFSGMALLFVTSLARILLDIGEHKKMNYVLVFLSGFLFCVLRNNGLYAFALTSIVLLIVFFKNYKVLTVGLLITAACSYILTGPIINMLNIVQPDAIEHLSIPAQQIARVVAEGCELSEGEYTTLSNIINVEKIPQIYQSQISDPIKNAVRAHDGNKYITENKWDVIWLWIKLGLKHPQQYLAAWLDQTKGYYYGGHNYWMFPTGIDANELGISQTVVSNRFQTAAFYYIDAFHNPNKMPILNVFVSLGFIFWIIAGAFALALAKDNIKVAFVFAPIILIILSLLIATPVYSELRYAYSALIAIPLVGMLFCKSIFPTKRKKI